MTESIIKSTNSWKRGNKRKFLFPYPPDTRISGWFWRRVWLRSSQTIMHHRIRNIFDLWMTGHRRNFQWSVWLNAWKKWIYNRSTMNLKHLGLSILCFEKCDGGSHRHYVYLQSYHWMICIELKIMDVFSSTHSICPICLTSVLSFPFFSP